jgi:hypothetical protein
MRSSASPETSDSFDDLAPSLQTPLQPLSSNAPIGSASRSLCKPRSGGALVARRKSGPGVRAIRASSGKENEAPASQGRAVKITQRPQQRVSGGGGGLPVVQYNVARQFKVWLCVAHLRLHGAAWPCAGTVASSRSLKSYLLYNALCMQVEPLGTHAKEHCAPHTACTADASA